MEQATKKKAVLVVDDNELELDILVECLGDIYSVGVAMDGPSALEDIQKNLPDIILLDIMMPGMDGFEVCRRLKSNPSTEKIPIIFVTAMEETEDEAKGFDLGAVDYITKPISPSIVKARVRNHLLIKSQRDQLEKSISLLEHEAEILGQKAEIGIQASGLAHDMANVLSVASFIKFIIEDLPDDFPKRSRVMKDLGTLGDSMQMGVDICRGFTNYIKDIGEASTVQPIVDLLQPIDMYARQYKGELVHKIDTAIPLVDCKAYQIKRVIVNLFVNAIQALEGQANQKIIIRLWKEKDRVFFSITDNGPGINVDVLPQIFEELFTTKNTGTGFGLFLVKQIVEGHHGSIEVHSEVDEGTEFIVSLPVANEI